MANTADSQMLDVAFSGQASFCNEVSITSDSVGLHRLAFIEVDPNGKAHHRGAVVVHEQLLERILEMFSQRIQRERIIRPAGQFGAN